VEVRLARADDAPAIAAIYEPIVRDTAISFELVPPSADEMGRRLEEDMPTHPWLVAVNEGVVGYAYAHPFSERAAYAWSVSSSIYVDDAWKGQGVGRQLYGALFRLVEHQGFRRAIAGITLPNPASQRLHESFGFEAMGVYERVGWKLGAWHDVLMLQRPIGSSRSTPQPPESVERIDPATLRGLLGP
jgi:L-amino acid N-acyltransferase YncA